MLRLVLILLAIGYACGSVMGQAPTGGSTPFHQVKATREIDPQWLEMHQADVDEMLEMLSSAYALDENGTAELRQELMSRLAAQYQYEQERMPAIAKKLQALEEAGAAEDSPEVLAAQQEFMQFMAQMPMQEEAVASWLETRIPAESAQLGRARYDELKQRQNAVIAARDDDNHRLAGRKTEMIADMKAREAIQTPAGNPVPHGPKAAPVIEQNRRIEEARVVEPNRGLPPPAQPQAPPTPHTAPTPPPAAQPQPQPNRGTPKPGEILDKAGPAVARVDPAKPAAQPGTPPGRPAAPPPAAAKAEPAPLAVAPPLDDWDRYVAQTAEKCQFTEAQVTTARSILADLRRRAYQYQMSRSADFARAHLITDSKARQAELARLNKPIDALFNELKVRLDSLLTAEQRRIGEKDAKGGSKPAAAKPSPPPAKPATPPPAKPSAPPPAQPQPPAKPPAGDRPPPT